VEPEDVIVASYGNGYRPTAAGTIRGRQFFFRMDGAGEWEFGVEREGAPPSEWKSFFSSEEQLQYFAEGSAGGCRYHDEALSTFLSALAEYLERAGVQDARGALLRSVKTQAEAFLDPMDRRF